MADWYIVKLLFTSPTHFGSFIKGSGVENVQLTLNSDTIFSALCNVWIKYNIIRANEIEQINTNDDFLISSGFPFIFKSGIPNYFFTTPKLESKNVVYFPGSIEDKGKLKKLLKQTKYLPVKYFKNHIQDNELLFKNDYDIIASEILEYQSAYVQQLLPKHTQDRINNVTQLYYQGQITFDSAKGGLFFIIKLDNKKWENIFNEGLKALSKEGFGGERSFMGSFLSNDNYGILNKISEGDGLSFLYSDDLESNYRCLLSLYYPDTTELNELQKPDQYYELIFKRGWVFSNSTYSQLKRKTVPFLSEGSVFDFNPKGMVVDAQPQIDCIYPHPVWKWGKALTVNI